MVAPVREYPPRVSIVLPAWNAGATLAASLGKRRAPDRAFVGMHHRRRWIHRRHACLGSQAARRRGSSSCRNVPMRLRFATVGDGWIRTPPLVSATPYARWLDKPGVGLRGARTTEKNRLRLTRSLHIRSSNASRRGTAGIAPSHPRSASRGSSRSSSC